MSETVAAKAESEADTRSKATVAKLREIILSILPDAFDPAYADSQLIRGPSGSSVEMLIVEDLVGGGWTWDPKKPSGKLRIKLFKSFKMYKMWPEPKAGWSRAKLYEIATEFVNGVRQFRAREAMYTVINENNKKFCEFCSEFKKKHGYGVDVFPDGKSGKLCIRLDEKADLAKVEAFLVSLLPPRNDPTA